MLATGKSKPERQFLTASCLFEPVIKKISSRVLPKAFALIETRSGGGLGEL